MVAQVTRLLPPSWDTRMEALASTDVWGSKPKFGNSVSQIVVVITYTNMKSKQPKGIRLQASTVACSIQVSAAP